MTGFSKLFWGFIFILLDFRLQRFDILPDIIGYLLIYSGLEQLTKLSDHFNRAKKYAIPLAFLSFFDIVQFQQPINSLTSNPHALFLVIIGIILSIIDLRMVYHICTGIAKAALEINEKELKRIASNRWKYYLVTKIAFLMITPVMAGNQSLQLILGVPLVFILLIIMILIVLLMKRSNEVFGPPEH